MVLAWTSKYDPRDFWLTVKHQTPCDSQKPKKGIEILLDSLRTDVSGNCY